MRRFLFGFVLVCLLLAHSLDAQVAITAVPYLQINNNASSVGLAEADVAKLGSMNGLHLNPALMGGFDGIQLAGQFNFTDGISSGTDWLPSFTPNLEITTPQIVLSYGKLSIGYEHTYLSLGRESITQEDSPEVISTFSSYEFSNMVAFAFRPNRFISLGYSYTSFKSVLGSETSIDDDKRQIKAEGSTYDLGTHFNYPFDLQEFTLTPVLGVSLTDIGDDVSYNTNAFSKSDPIPTMFRIGTGVELRSKEKWEDKAILSASFYASLSKIMARRKENGTPYTGWDAILNSWDTYTFLNGSETIELSIGEQFQRSVAMEFSYLESFNLRLGRYYEDPNNGDRSYYTFGFGINYLFFKFDYAHIVDNNDSPLDNTKFMQLSVHVPFDTFFQTK